LYFLFTRAFFFVSSADNVMKKHRSRMIAFRMFNCAVFFVVFLLILPLPVFAAPPAPPTDAGQLLREQQPQLQLPQRFPEEPKVVERPALTDTGVKVTVTEIRFTGFEGLATQEELRPLVADAIGRALTFRELQALAGKVTAYLRQKGYFLARAYLPKQDVSHGIIEIAIVQGRLEGEAVINRAAGVRLQENVPREIMKSAVQAGAPVQDNKLERALLLMNDLPSISARASLGPGTAPGETKLTINVDEGPLFSGGVWADNYGNRFTGDWRGNAAAYLNDPLKIGDQASLQIIGAQGLIQGRAGYSLPIGSQGLRASFGVTGMSYEVLESLSPLESKGDAINANAGLSYPIVRSRIANLTAMLGYEYDIYKDEVLGIQIHNKRVQTVSAGLSGDYYDRYLGGGYSVAGLTVTTGYLDLSRVDADKAQDDDTAHTNGQFTRVNINLARLQRLTDALALSLSYSGQFATGDLDSSQKFFLGGPYAVRAYPVGEAPCDEGHLMSAELRYNIALTPVLGALQIIGFYDAGYAILHKYVWGAIGTATGENQYWISGIGGGVSVSRPSLYALRFMYAHRVGDNPGRGTDGNNADGRDDKGHFWLLAALYF
jgi:hemolysin activation/secretion protein